jgi:hypothetical protein
VHNIKHIFRHFALLKYFTYHLVPVLAPNYKQHILSSAEVRKVCCSLAELYVRRSVKSMNILKGRELQKFGNVWYKE